MKLPPSLHDDPRLATRNVADIAGRVQRCMGAIARQAVRIMAKRDLNSTIFALVALIIAPLGAYSFFGSFMAWGMSDGTGEENGKVAGHILHFWWFVSVALIAATFYAKSVSRRLFCACVLLVYLIPAILLAVGSNRI